MLNEWLDEIRTWLYESNSRRIMGFFIIAAAVNSVLWAFSEPTGINFKLCGYPFYHYGAVILITTIIFISLLPRKSIKVLTIDNAPELFKNDKWEIAQGTPVVSIVNDNNYGN